MIENLTSSHAVIQVIRVVCLNILAISDLLKHLMYQMANQTAEIEQKFSIGSRSVTGCYRWLPLIPRERMNPCNFQRA